MPNLALYCQTLVNIAGAEGNEANLQGTPNQWSIFGWIQANGSARVFDLEPGGGTQIYVAGGDDTAEDMDLTVDANDETVVLKRDTDRVRSRRRAARSEFGPDVATNKGRAH